MERADINGAIRSLAGLDRAEAAEEALTYAERLMPISAEYQTPADLTALRVLAIALYFTAAAGPGQQNSSALSAIVEERYVRLRSEPLTDDIFTRPLPEYPEPLNALLRALADVPRALVIAGFESVRYALSTSASDGRAYTPVV